jgi:glycine dehydrogenase subunit 2
MLWSMQSTKSVDQSIQGANTMRNVQSTLLLSELSKTGRSSVQLPPLDVPEGAWAGQVPSGLLADRPPALPELAEGDVVRHFTNLSTLNMSVDTHFYPLGSCTMKYNPKRNERLASIPGMIDLHPMQPAQTIQGLLELMYQLQKDLAEISGLPGVSLQPAAGAHGELTALMVAAAWFRKKGEKRRQVLTLDSAHGTNPASAKMAGWDTICVPRSAATRRC